MTEHTIATSGATSTPADGFATSVTQADMPTAGNGFRRKPHEPFDAVAYRIYSADRQRSALFRFSHGVQTFATGFTVYVFHGLLAGRAHRLDLDASQLSQLRAADRIEAICGGGGDDDGPGRDDDVEMPETRLPTVWRKADASPRKISVSPGGDTLSSGAGTVPGTLLCSEVSILHLRALDIVLSANDRGSRAKVTFSSHCWTVKDTPSPSSSDGPVILDENGKPRRFSPERYRLSLGLPDMFRRLRVHRVYHTGTFDNLGAYTANGTKTDAYTAFFSIDNATDGSDRSIFRVRSAYMRWRPVNARGIDIVRHLLSVRQRMHANDDVRVRLGGNPDGTA